MNDIAPEMSSFAVEAIKDPSQPYPFFKLSPDIHPDKLNQQQKELLNRANVFLQIVNDNLQIFRPFTDVKIPI